MPRWLDGLWGGGEPPYVQGGAVGRAAHAERIVAGGFPAVIERAPARRRAWLRDYLEALTARDVPDLVSIRRPDLLPVLLRHLAGASGSPVSMRPIAQALAVEEKTVRAYVRLLELLYLVVSVPAWAPGFGTRAVRAPRLFVEDTAMLTYLLDADATRIAADANAAGRAYETFAAMELARLLPYTATAPVLRHWRGPHGEEVDLVLEDRGGRVIAIEIKAGATIGRGDLRWLQRFRGLAGERFVAGLVLCTARRTTPLGERLWAVPIDALWSEGRSPAAAGNGGD